jgi:hypothetical protein
MFAKLKADGLHKKNMGLGGGLMGKSLMAAAKLDEGYSPTKPAGMSMLRAAKTVGKDQTASLARAVRVRRRFSQQQVDLLRQLTRSPPFFS